MLATQKKDAYYSASLSVNQAEKDITDGLAVTRLTQKFAYCFRASPQRDKTLGWIKTLQNKLTLWQYFDVYVAVQDLDTPLPLTLQKELIYKFYCLLCLR